MALERRRTPSGLLAVGVILASALSASAVDRREPTDGEIRRAVLLVVQTSPYLTAFDSVQVGVETGEVVLRGSVQYPHRRSRLLARVASLPGVRAVRDEITVQPASASDDRLRRRLFERLYYGGGIAGGDQPEWPVRILVSEGHVTLVGEVPGSLDRERLETMAWDVGARSVENLLRAQVTYARMTAAQN